MKKLVGSEAEICFFHYVFAPVSLNPTVPAKGCLQCFRGTFPILVIQVNLIIWEPILIGFCGRRFNFQLLLKSFSLYGNLSCFLVTHSCFMRGKKVTLNGDLHKAIYQTVNSHAVMAHLKKGKWMILDMCEAIHFYTLTVSVAQWTISLCRERRHLFPILHCF